MADDDPEDCMLANEALVESGAAAVFTCVGDGIELLEYCSNIPAQTRRSQILFCLT